MIKDTIVNGAHNAPHRSLYNALGLTKEELDRPLIGIVSSYNEIVPGHMNLDKITEAVRVGVAMAGGTPIVFPAIAVCDGIAMPKIIINRFIGSKAFANPAAINCKVSNILSPP